MIAQREIKSFEDLECWKANRDVRQFVSEVIKKFPVEERYALTDGMRRASHSITENVAEGYGRFHYQENIQFVRISRGSLYELIDQFITAKDEKYINDDEYQKGRELINKAIMLVNGYIKYLVRSKKQQRVTNNK